MNEEKKNILKNKITGEQSKNVVGGWYDSRRGETYMRCIYCSFTGRIEGYHSKEEKLECPNCGELEYCSDE